MKPIKSSLPPLYGPMVTLHLHYCEIDHPKWGWPVRVVMVNASLGQQMSPAVVMYAATVEGTVAYAAEMNWRIHETFV